MAPALIDLSNAEIAGENPYVVRRTAEDAAESFALVITGVPFNLSIFPESSFDVLLAVPKERVRTVKPIANTGSVEGEVELITDHPILQGGDFMNISQFWTLIKRNPDKPLPGPVLQLAPVSILELTEDGMAFIWPIEPDREDRCQYCVHYRGVPTSVFSVNEYRATYCQPPVHPSYPCNFIAAPDAEHQDLDSYILDGACQDAGGYFDSLQQFLNDHDYSERDLTVITLGSLSGISSAREAWSQYIASLRQPNP